MASTHSVASQQRKHYYEEQFQYKENTSGSLKDRVQRESPVIAELRTNVIIKDEFTLVTDLSYHLAARYTRPESAIMVKVDHSACLAMGGKFDPCYLLTITALPANMGPTMNKRNAALIQSFMSEILSVPPERGIVRFQPMPEENLATNGTTLLGEVERQEKLQTGGENGGTVRRAITNASRKSMPSFKKSTQRLVSESKTAEDGKAPSIHRKDSGMTNGSADIRRLTISGPTGFTHVGGVFELPAELAPKPRPASSHNSSSVSNGLRMNGVSSMDLSLKATTTKARPKTYSGEEGSSIQDQLKKNAMAAAGPPPARFSTMPAPSKQQRPPSFLKTDPTQRPTTPRQTQSGDRKNRDSYLDGLLAASIPASKDGKASEKDKDTEANTAKRRSTITAMPKMPPAPPIPQTPAEDRKSVKSMKIGKRKSFMSAFKRSTATAS